MADAVRAAQVDPDGRLTVGTSPDEVESPGRAEDTCAEAGHDVSTFVFKGHRWHRDEDVIRLVQAGVAITSSASIAAQLMGDLAQSPKAAEALKLLFEISIAA